MMVSKRFFLSNGNQKEHADIDSQVENHSPIFLNTHTSHIPSPHSKLPRSVNQLKQQIANLDKEYDGCQDVWADGEAQGFISETLLI